MRRHEAEAEARRRYEATEDDWFLTVEELAKDRREQNAEASGEGL